MPNDINGLDVNDDGLKGIFGDRFHDETVAVSKKETTTTPKVEKPAQKAAHKPVDAQWEPVKPAPYQMDKLKACAKSALLYGGLSLMFFYFQQSGQMAMTASMPCICACCVMAGWGVGKNARGNV
jgi:hypothetical protein